MKKPGYILMLTILGIAVAVGLITVVVQQAILYQQQTRLALDKSQARQLVFSSLELALSQVSLVLPKEDNEKKEEKKEELKPYQRWLLRVLSKINKWHTYELTEDLEGTITYYLASEQGKINLSSFESELQGIQQPKKDAQPSAKQQSAGQAAKADEKKEEVSPLQAVDELIKKEKDIGIKDALKRFYSQFRRVPEDITELLKIERFKEFKDQLFMTPGDSKKIVLTDLFTVRHNEKMNPFLFTKSVKKLLGLKDGIIDEEMVKKIQPKFDWAQEWDKLLVDTYGKKFSSLPEGISTLFATEFGVTGFSVVSYCTVGTITQKVFAVLELTEPGPDISPKSLVFKVGKLYWL